VLSEIGEDVLWKALLKELDYQLKSSINIEEHLRHSKA